MRSLSILTMLAMSLLVAQSSLAEEPEVVEAPTDVTVASYEITEEMMEQLIAEALAPQLPTAFCGDPEFDALVSPSIWDTVRDDSMDAAVRLNDGAARMQSLSGKLMEYQAAASQSESAQCSVIEITGVLLRGVEPMLMSALELKATFDPNAEDYALRVNGIQQMRGGFGQMYRGSFQMLSAPDLYDANRTSLVKHIADTLPSLVEHISEDDRAFIYAQLTTQMDDPANAAHKKTMKKLAKKVQKAKSNPMYND